jgi:hypothetical protein
MKKTSKAAAFLENMTQEPVEATKPVSREKKEQGRGKTPTGTRDGLKHIGGYLNTHTVERVAILRARLNLDNSELIKLAIDELYSKQKAKRVFNE